jgi:hypothetical protein
MPRLMQRLAVAPHGLLLTCAMVWILLLWIPLVEVEFLPSGNVLAGAFVGSAGGALLVGVLSIIEQQ